MSDAEKGIAVLMTVHNRRATTIACLERLLPQLHAEDKVFIVDDGSTDGTREAVESLGGSGDKRIRLVQGSGNVYWAKGMALAWRTAIDDGPNAGFLWLNDDAMLSTDALRKMRAVDDGKGLIVGQLVDSTGKEVYGLNVNGWVNGNFVYVPRKVYEKVGMICGEYAHAWADSDYAMRCKKVGVSITSCGVVGLTEWHELRPSLNGLGFKDRLRILREPKGWNLHDLWLYRRRNWGLVPAIVSTIHFVFHVLFLGR